jgi:hypothetical protein
VCIILQGRNFEECKSDIQWLVSGYIDPSMLDKTLSIGKVGSCCLATFPCILGPLTNI